MSDPNDPIALARNLVESLYDNSDLSIDQADGLLAGLAAGADCRRALAAALDENDRWRSVASAAAQVLTQKDAEIGALESRLGQAHADLTAAEVKLARAIEQNGYLGRLVEQLRTAATPAATLLFDLDQRGGLGLDVHRVIAETRAPLDTVLAVAKERGS